MSIEEEYFPFFQAVPAEKNELFHVNRLFFKRNIFFCYFLHNEDSLLKNAYMKS